MRLLLLIALTALVAAQPVARRGDAPPPPRTPPSDPTSPPAAAPSSSRGATGGLPPFATREGVLTGTGPVFKASGKLAPFQAAVYTIPARPTSPGGPDPDVYVRVDTRQAGSAPHVGLFCDPGWEDTGVEADRFPQPGSRTWEGDAFVDEVALTIPRTDRTYRPPPGKHVPGGSADYSPSFVCAVVNQDAVAGVQYRLEVDLASSNATLAPAQQAALAAIYTKCCPPSSAGDGSPPCAPWRALAIGADARPVTDFCGVAGHVCTPGGSLAKLNLNAYGLACPLPAAELASFPALTTLNLARNPGLTGRASDLFDALATVPSLRFVNLYKCTGLTGPLATPAAGSSGGRRLAQADEEIPQPSSPRPVTLGGGGGPVAPADSVIGAGGTTPATPARPGGGPFGRPSSRPVPTTLPPPESDALPPPSPPAAAPTAPKPSSKLAASSSGRGLCTMVSNGLAALDAAASGLDGPIPPCLTGAGSKLVELHLGGNALTGSLPPVRSNSPLQAFTAYQNSLTGPIPPSLATAPALRLLDVAENGLTGTIPDGTGR